MNPNDYYVEIWSDDDQHFIRIAELDSFDEARGLFSRLTADEDKADMRVVMRRRAHVFDAFIPKRLRRETDRRG